MVTEEHYKNIYSYIYFYFVWNLISSPESFRPSWAFSAHPTTPHLPQMVCFLLLMKHHAVSSKLGKFALSALPSLPPVIKSSSANLSSQDRQRTKGTIIVVIITTISTQGSMT